MKIVFLKLRPKKHPFPLLSWLIMLFQGMNPFSRKAYSHMAISFNIKEGYSQVADFSFSGFAQTKENLFFEKYYIVDSKCREFNISRQDFLDWLDSHKGKKYDFCQIVGLALKLLRLKRVNHTGSDLDRLICSELIISFLVRFAKLEVRDSDDWDLNMTWEVI